MNSGARLISRERLPMIFRWRGLFLLLLSQLLPLGLPAQVSSDRLLHSSAEPQNWLTYSGGYSSHRYSPLQQIGPANVKDLELKWVFQAQSLEKFDSTPLVAAGAPYSWLPSTRTSLPLTPRMATLFGMPNWRMRLPGTP